MRGRRTAKRVLEGIAAAHRRHRARHAPTGFDIAIGPGVAALPSADWDAVTGHASVFVSRDYLSALDAAPPANVSPCYALAYRDGRPLVAVAAQFVDASAADAAPQDGRRRRALQRLVRARLLVCGNLLAWGRHGVTFAPGAAPADAWPAVADALYRMRRARHHPRKTDLVVVKDLTDADAADVAPLETYSYRAFETEPDMVLELPASCASLADYLALLRSKHRKVAKSVLSDVEDAGYRLEPLDAARDARRLHALYLGVRSNASIRLFTLPEDHLARAAAALGPRFRCVGLVRDGAIDGFVTVVKDGATAVGWFIGFDRAANDRAPLYLRLLYAAVENALEMGCRRISFGRTALEPKARLGARPVPLRCWVRHRVPIANVALRRWLREMPHADAPEHSPLKDG